VEAVVVVDQRRQLMAVQLQKLLNMVQVALVLAEEEEVRFVAHIHVIRQEAAVVLVVVL